MWVDDGLAMCKVRGKLENILNYLKTTFEVTVGDAYVYVGLHITHNRDHRIISIDQQRFPKHC